MAYHLHRLHLTGKPLQEILNGKAQLATALSQGRTAIEPNLRTNCVDPLAYYYAPLGLALLLIIVGAVQLITTAINKPSR